MSKESYMVLSRADAKRLLLAMWNCQSEDKQVRQITEQLSEYLERFEQPRLKRENAIRKLAWMNFHVSGDLEIEAAAVVAEGEENGAYVLSWQWVPFDGTKFDKENK